MTTRTIVLTAVTMAAFASNSLLCRAALQGEHADPASFTALRVASGALALGLLARSRRRRSQEGDRRPRPTRGGWGSASALFAYAIGFSLAYVHVPAGTGALLLFAAVQATMVAGGLRAGERPRARAWVGLLVSLVGLVALTRPGLSQPSPAGALLMLGAGVAWGVYSLRGRGAGDALAETFGSFARAVPLALLASALGLVVALPRLDVSGALLAVASGALASGLGYALWYLALQGLTATEGAIVQLSVPPLAAAGGVLLLGEAVTPRLVVASLLILGGIALAVATPRPSEPRPAVSDADA